MITPVQNSESLGIFQDFLILEPGTTYAGYSALILAYQLAVPCPDTLCAIGPKHKTYQHGGWRLFTPRHKPADTLQAHLTFALKYEGVDLGVLKALFAKIDPDEIIRFVETEPTGAYSRRIWFLYEWLLQIELKLPDSLQAKYVSALDETLQYAAPAVDSRRHRVRNNLPGTPMFCPLIRRTAKLQEMITLDLAETARVHIDKTHPDWLSRAAAFLLLKDSKASYTIEGESPVHSRIERWGRIIARAGQRPLSIQELEHLQLEVIADNRFIKKGCRTEGGFIGEHDRSSGMPMPVHISAKPQDLLSLLNGMVECEQLLNQPSFNAVLAASVIAFGFVFIHPFEDGNGRVHRYLFHHLLAKKQFVPAGLVFPVSAVILKKLDEYQQVLEHYSRRRLPFIEWRPTPKGNVEVLNNTADLYRYFDATRQAEFLFDCVFETVNHTLPSEVDYLQRYDQLNAFIKNYIEMPDKMISLLIRFLEQHRGKLSKRALGKEFSALSDDEVLAIEQKYAEVYAQ